MDKRDFNFTHLPGYAKYILDNKLNEFAAVTIELSRQAGLPLLNALTDITETELLHHSTESVKTMLQALEQQRAADHIQQTAQRISTNTLPLINRVHLSSEDLIIGFHIRRQAFAAFLDGYTRDAGLQKALMAEADRFTTLEELSIAGLCIDLQREQISFHRDLLLESQQLAGLGSYVVDFRDRSKSFYTPQCLQIFEMEKPTSLDEFMNWVHPEDRAHVQSALAKTMEKGGEFEMEYRYLKSTEKRLWTKGITLCEGGQPVMLKGTVRDITQRYNLIQTLKETERLFRQSQELNLFGSWSWETAAGTLNWSEEMFRIFEIEPGRQLSFGQFLEFIHPDDAARVRQEVEDSSRNGNPLEIIYKIVSGKGRIKLVHSVGRAICNEHNLVTGFYGICQDITNLHTLQREITLQAKAPQ